MDPETAELWHDLLGRLGRLERAVLGGPTDDGLADRIERIERRCGALVIEEDDENGSTIIRARPAQVGLDWRFVVGAALTLVTSGVVPILVAHAAA